MNLITATYMNLTRARRQMQEAFLTQNWADVEEWDQLLTVQMNRAFEDPQRDNALLVRELEKILSLYAEMAEFLPAANCDQWLDPARAPCSD